MRAIGGATQRNFEGPIQTIIPWASNLYTETLIDEVRAKPSATAFWGFWMLGGMSGGGMGFIFDPAHKAGGARPPGRIDARCKQRLAGGVPFAMEPVVYDFSINERGTLPSYLRQLGHSARRLLQPGSSRGAAQGPALAFSLRASDLERFSLACQTPGARRPTRRTFSIGCCRRAQEPTGTTIRWNRCCRGMASIPSSTNAFSRAARRPHRACTESASGLQLNRRRPADLSSMPRKGVEDELPHRRGGARLRRGRGRNPAGGAGSRWTRGAGVVKALSPFCRLAGKASHFS